MNFQGLDKSFILILHTRHLASLLFGPRVKSLSSQVVGHGIVLGCFVAAGHIIIIGGLMLVKWEGGREGMMVMENKDQSLVPVFREQVKADWCPHLWSLIPGVSFSFAMHL